MLNLIYKTKSVYKLSVTFILNSTFNDRTIVTIINTSVVWLIWGNLAKYNCMFGCVETLRLVLIRVNFLQVYNAMLTNISRSALNDVCVCTYHLCSTL